MVNTNKIAIIGGGKMASNIVEYLIQFDVSILWYIRSASVLQEKKNKIAKKISRLLKAGNDDQELESRKHEVVTFTDSFRYVRDADIIIECVSESIESKRDVFNELQGTNAIVFSNTSSLPLGSFIPEKMRGQSAGLHFFYPVQLKQFVELNILKETELPVLETMRSFVGSIDKRALELPEEHHFVLNRIFLSWLAQSSCAVQKYTISFDRFDREIVKSLFPLGPFTFMKNVGFDIMNKSVEMYCQKSKSPGFFAHLNQLLENAKVQGDWVVDGIPATDDNEQVMAAAFEVQSVFVNAVYHELAAQYVDDQLLIEALADYAGVSREAINQLLHDITPSLLETLRRLYNATYWDVYRPSMKLLRNIKKPDQR